MDYIAAVLAQREAWVDLGGGKRVRVRRPAEMQMAQLRGGFRPEHAASFVNDWSGFTAADCGSEGDAAVLFDAALWGVLVEDNAQWFEAVATKVIDMVNAHLARREAVSGN